jgi:DNA mismatch repair protein MutL
MCGGDDLLHVTPVPTLRERVYQVFGSQTLEELVELGDCRRELFLPPPAVPPSDAIAAYAREPDEPPSRTFRVTGFISRPQVQKANRNSIFTFVNGRLIRDRVLLHAISSAYHNLMPQACYPFALLFLECDCEEVDVNVHPSKTEVRFRHGSFVHDFIRDTLRDRLIETRPAPAFLAAAAPQPAQALPYSESTQMIENEPPEVAELVPEGRSGTCPTFTLRPEPSPPPRLDFGTGAVAIGSEHLVDSRPAKMRIPETHGEFPPGTLPPFSSSLTALGDLRPLGQIHESFIIAAGRDGLWIIDQHVAHERILFEKVLKQRAAGRVEMQALLMPLIVQLTAEQQIEYARIADELQSIGFETEPFGARTIAVKAAPAAVPVSDLEKLIFEILETAEGEVRGLSMDDIRRNIAASIACRAAIKINMRLDQNKMEWLLAALAATDCPMSCPHGRPIALQYPTREILKAFHRI